MCQQEVVVCYEGFSEKLADGPGQVQYVLVQNFLSSDQALMNAPSFISLPFLLFSLIPSDAATMAYNREWDRGKDAYGDPGAWDNNGYGGYGGNAGWGDHYGGGGGGGRGNVRGREDEYYGDGKRRKYNNGVRGYFFNSVPYNPTSFQGYDASYQDDSGYDAGYGHGRNDWGQDPSQDKGFNKKRMVPSEPSPHVIFLGLDPDFTEADVCAFSLNLSTHILTSHAQLQAYLTSNNCSIETVTIIRDRSTGTYLAPSYFP